MKWKLFAIFIFLPFCIQSVSFQQVGVILHHDDKLPNGALSAYIGNLNQQKCQYISEFNILSSSPDSLEISNLQQQANTLFIPLHFDFKIGSQAIMKLRIAEGSTAELYFVGSLNTTENCQKIGEYLGFAQAHDAAGLVPLVGEFEQTSVITVDNGQKNFERYFNYGQNPKLNHFQIVENIRLFSRHTLELAQSNIREVRLMSNHTPICQEIFLNFVLAHFYPELRSRINKFASRLPPVDTSKTAAVKSKCIRSFIEILGYCPLFYQKKIFNSKIWKNPNFNQVIELKKVALNAEILYHTQGRLLFPQIEQTTQNFDESQWFSQFEMTILLTLGTIITILLFVIFLLRVKIKTLSTHVPSNSAQSVPLRHNQC